MIRFATIGTNFIVDRMLEAARNCPDFVLDTVYSRSIDKAVRFAAKYGANHYTDNLDDLCNSNTVDAVYVASPNYLHQKQTNMLACARKHILCEKPIATSLTDLENMLSTARKNEVVLLEAMRPVFLPSVKKIKELLSVITPLRRISINYCQYSSRYDKYKNGIIENAFNPTLGNGALMDIGVYCVNMLLWLAGMPEKVSAKGIFLPNSIDALGQATFIYEGFIAEVFYSKVHDSYSSSVIEGEGGSISFYPAAAPTNIYLTKRDGVSEQIFSDQCSTDMQYELKAFIDMVRGRDECELYHEHSLNSLKIMDEMRRQIGIDFTKYNENI